VCASLPLIPISGAFDLVFSTATFHWVHDHEGLFRQIHDALVPGGRLVAQCGGGPNLARVHERAVALMRTDPYARWFSSWRPAWHFADAETTARRLSAAGFTGVRTTLHEAPAVLEDRDRYDAFLTTVIFRDHLQYLPDPALRRQFIEALGQAAAGDTPPFSLDYWRLNMEAVKPAGTRR
jgi:trans-aconitate 2-methyltransferase